MQSTPGSSEHDDGEGGLFAEINITPLTDVFLVLLIIMMVVSASVIEEEKEELEGEHEENKEEDDEEEEEDDDGEVLLALCDDIGDCVPNAKQNDVSGKPGAAKNRVLMKGVSSFKAGSNTYYRASLGFKLFVLRSQ